MATVRGMGARASHTRTARPAVPRWTIYSHRGMSGSAQGVTPAGVRDGELAALQALTAARGSAVLAYCRAVCGEELAPRAAAEAFARFRAAVHAAEHVAGMDPDAILLGATRHAAASLAPAPPAVQHHGPGLLDRARGRPGGESCA